MSSMRQALLVMAFAMRRGHTRPLTILAGRRDGAWRLALALPVAMACSSFGEAASSGGPDGGDAATGGAEVACGANVCTAGNACCFSDNGGATDARCVGPRATCAGTNTQLVTCDDPSDCPGQICCARVSGYRLDPVACVPTCTGPVDAGSGSGSFTVCRTGADCPTAACVAIETLVGRIYPNAPLRVCKP